MTSRISLPVLAAMLLMLLFSSCVHIEVPDEAAFTFDNEKDMSSYTLGGASIAQAVKDISIDWIDGDVTIEYYDGDHVLLSETADRPLDSLTTLCYRVSPQGELSVCFTKSRKLKKEQFEGLNKKLLIRLPQGTRLGDLEIDGMNVVASIAGITCEDISLDGMNAQLSLSNLVCEEIDADGLNAQLTLTDVRCHSVSADGMNATISATFGQMPDEVSADGMNAHVTLAVPADAGLSIEMDGLAQDLTSDLPVYHKDGKTIIGDGRCDVSLDGAHCTLDIVTRID